MLSCQPPRELGTYQQISHPRSVRGRRGYGAEIQPASFNKTGNRANHMPADTRRYFGIGDQEEEINSTLAAVQPLVLLLHSKHLWRKRYVALNNDQTEVFRNWEQCARMQRDEFVAQYSQLLSADVEMKLTKYGEQDNKHMDTADEKFDREQTQDK